MTPFIPYGRQSISQQDIDAVVAVLKSDWLTQGPAIAQFEQAVADYCGVSYAVAVSSATAALHIACLAAELGSRDTLWTSPNTFVASANCGLYCGATVDFVDIDPKTYNLDIALLQQKLSWVQQDGTLPKVVVPVHFAGQSCDMEAISSLAQQYDFTVIEDASHAIGGQYRGRPVGCCQFSDMAVFSFHPVKIVTTGEGGMVLTNQKALYEKLIRFRSHGITREPEQMQGESHGPWYYEQLELGFNYRMTDIQAALGTSQMQRLPAFVQRRQMLADRYFELLQGLPIMLPVQPPETASSWHLFVIRLMLNTLQLSHRQVFETLRDKGIGVNLHYIPVHTQPYYQTLGFRPGDFPEAEQYYREAISLPLHYEMSLDEQDYIVDCLRACLT
ncbi:UDP-4-amino-4,6-dideoxy-N-acetyl-beta-L-altrosamine transaminase [Nodosilinea sp. FACHB-13]|uniref:UDP-4-amino-4, 6-dideoxy-N-acetyl-beta-L-altrosamine transaminase n=1 Tax=Cyanophyceae TaxID=3028117 RepID=UPI00168967D7|nr:UDP-4-amino-4,6-dideoxy-N-acetyl-beta-L-altrosamine transaminase [Nodosilinea sp. FACHB-13]MBD2108558.1 UDP-4-amino-4,6-dideoxy-N-acetyl-beta-L-altrosamine transaminase [Nodosilinea sp. FACHB-13]